MATEMSGRIRARVVERTSNNKQKSKKKKEKKEKRKKYLLHIGGVAAPRDQKPQVRRVAPTQRAGIVAFECSGVHREISGN